MKLCIPIEQSRGLASIIASQFEKATAFLIADTETMVYETITPAPGDLNPLRNPLLSLTGHYVNALAVHHIEETTLARLCSARMPVFYFERASAQKIIQSLKGPDAGRRAASRLHN